MQLIAEQGGGNFYYIEDIRQIPDYIDSEVGEALDVVAAASSSRSPGRLTSRWTPGRDARRAASATGR